MSSARVRRGTAVDVDSPRWSADGVTDSLEFQSYGDRFDPSRSILMLPHEQS